MSYPVSRRNTLYTAYLKCYKPNQDSVIDKVVLDALDNDTIFGQILEDIPNFPKAQHNAQKIISFLTSMITKTPNGKDVSRRKRLRRYKMFKTKFGVNQHLKIQDGKILETRIRKMQDENQKVETKTKIETETPVINPGRSEASGGSEASRSSVEIDMQDVINKSRCWSICGYSFIILSLLFLLAPLAWMTLDVNSQNTSFTLQGLSYVSRYGFVPFNSAAKKLPMIHPQTKAAWNVSSIDITHKRWQIVFTKEEQDLLIRLARYVGQREQLDELSFLDYHVYGFQEFRNKFREKVHSQVSNPWSGLGFVVYKQFPIRYMNPKEAKMVYQILGQTLGYLGQQTKQGNTLTSIKNVHANQKARLFRTNASIGYHTDWADIVGLLVNRTSAQGGLSCIASSMAIYNHLRRKSDMTDMTNHQDLQEWFNTTWIHLREAANKLYPYTPLTMGKYIPDPRNESYTSDLRTIFHADYFDHSKRSLPQKRLHQTIQALASNQKLFSLCMELEEGDIQFLSNHYILHSRQAFYDHPTDHTKQRHLLRMWVSLDHQANGDSSWFLKPYRIVKYLVSFMYMQMK